MLLYMSMYDRFLQGTRLWNDLLFLERDVKPTDLLIYFFRALSTITYETSVQTVGSIVPTTMRDISSADQSKSQD